jgi:hypothetical protein
MPKKRKDYITTSVALSKEHIEWIEKNTNVTVSAFIRELIDTKIDQASGYDVKIGIVDDKIKKAQFDIVLLQQERDSLEEKNTLFKESKEIERLSELIAKAIKKIRYSCWQEAAKDLDSARKEIDRESFMALVETIWFREQNGDGENVPIN